jgi:hypothetical protein
MSQTHRTLRIPDDVKELIERKGERPALWYVGRLQAENGIDVKCEPVENPPPDAPLEVVPARPSGKHPGKALRERGKRS